ncbi:uncharacterized protein FRV6_11989 [Fusarium oxysporum]|uniref:Uncharacterized protein n=1 Tax=Fusarium oxysporum TaxID=5507 RepID=A0A2H3TGQ6_FUSOX|nr:uncharacterized protein FRV6_11989 [Fusarium oxysporum]
MPFEGEYDHKFHLEAQERQGPAVNKPSHDWTTRPSIFFRSFREAPEVNDKLQSNCLTHDKTVLSHQISFDRAQRTSCWPQRATDQTRIGRDTPNTKKETRITSRLTTARPRVSTATSVARV